MYFIIAIIKLIIILGVVTTIHEFGHFLFSKLFKIGVNEFAIGFGPVIFQKKYKDTMYSLRAIPLGGFCAIEGEDGESDKEDSFAKKNVFQKIIVLVAGATRYGFSIKGIKEGAGRFPGETVRIVRNLPPSHYQNGVER